MKSVFSRRAVLGSLSVLGLGLLTGCDSNKPSFKYAKDLSNTIMGRSFKLKDPQGETRILPRA
mgnify:CR=1 FL=1